MIQSHAVKVLDHRMLTESKLFEDELNKVKSSKFVIYNHSFYDRKGVLFFDNFWDGKVEKLFFIIEDVECTGFRSNTVNNQMKILWSESQLTELKELENLIKEPLNKEDTFYLDCRFKLENGLVVQDFGLESADDTLNWKTLIGIPFRVKHLVVSYELIDGTSRLVCRCLNLVSIVIV